MAGYLLTQIEVCQRSFKSLFTTISQLSIIFFRKDIGWSTSFPFCFLQKTQIKSKISGFTTHYSLSCKTHLFSVKNSQFSMVFFTFWFLFQGLQHYSTWVIMHWNFMNFLIYNQKKLNEINLGKCFWHLCFIEKSQKFMF